MIPRYDGPGVNLERFLKRPQDDGPEPEPPPAGWHPWNRMGGEGDAAYRAFEHFRLSGSPDAHGLPGRRSIAETQRAIGHKSRTRIQHWSSTNDWHGRCAAWDHHLAKARLRGAESAAESLAQRHVGVATDLLATAEAEAKRFLELSASDDAALCRSPGEVAQIVKLVQEIQRLSLGQSTTNVSVKQTVSIEPNPEKPCDLSLLSETEVMLFEAIMRKSKGLPADHAGTGYAAALRAAAEAYARASCLPAPPAGPRPSNPFAR